MKITLFTLFIAFMLGSCAEGSELERTKKLANDGDETAQFNLGVMYANGKGVPKDYKEAEKWYIMSAKNGNSNALFNLGVMYNNEKAPKDNLYIAYAWLSAAKENGHEQAEKSLEIVKGKMNKEQIDKAKSLSTVIYKRIEINKMK